MASEAAGIHNIQITNSEQLEGSIRYLSAEAAIRCIKNSSNLLLHVLNGQKKKEKRKDTNTAFVPMLHSPYFQNEKNKQTKRMEIE